MTTTPRRPKKAEVLAAAHFPLEELLTGIDNVIGSLAPFGEPLSPEHLPYSPDRAGAARQALVTARMHIEHLYTETPHVPASHRPVVVADDEDE